MSRFTEVMDSFTEQDWISLSISSKAQRDFLESINFPAAQFRGLTLGAVKSTSSGESTSKPCRECKGAGKKRYIGGEEVCHWCGGSGVEPHPEDFSPQFRAMDLLLKAGYAALERK